MNVCVRLHEGHTAMVRHPHRQNTLLRQGHSVDIPAHHCGDDLVLVVPSTGDKKFVVAGCDGTTRPLPQTGHERPGVRQRGVAVHGMHGATCKHKQTMKNCIHVTLY